MWSDGTVTPVAVLTGQGGMRERVLKTRIHEEGTRTAAVSAAS